MLSMGLSGLRTKDFLIHSAPFESSEVQNRSRRCDVQRSGYTSVLMNLAGHDARLVRRLTNKLVGRPLKINNTEGNPQLELVCALQN